MKGNIMNGEGTSSPKIIIKAATIFCVLVTPAIVWSGFVKNTVVRDYMEGNSRTRRKALWGFPDPHTSSSILYNFHPLHGHLVQAGAVMCNFKSSGFPCTLFTKIKWFF